MPQLLFEPAATKIADDTFIVVPKNNYDEINVYETSETADAEDDESNDITSDVRSGTYHFIAKCSELVKDIIAGFYGNPITINGVKTGHSHSEAVIETLLVKYENSFLPEEREVDGETVSRYVITWNDNNETLFETREAALTAVVNYVKRQLQSIATQEQTIEEGEEE